MFFDIGGTLASPVLTPPPHRLERLDLYPFVPGVLKDLRGRGVRLGIISNTGDERGERIDEVLAAAGVLGFFDPALLVYSADVGMTKDSPEIFRLAAARAGAEGNPERCVFVGEDSTERAFAVQAGMRVAPHPLLAAAALQGEPMRFVRVTVPAEHEGTDWRGSLRGLPAIPLHVAADPRSRMYAITTDATAADLDDLRFEVDRLGAANDPLTTDLYLVRDDRAAATGFLVPEGQAHHLDGARPAGVAVLSSTAEGLFVAVPAGRSIEELHLPQAYHGHTLKLSPDTALLEPFGTEGRAGAAWLAAAPPDAPEPPLDERARAALETLDAERIRRHVERYAGAAPLDDAGTGRIASRHIQSADMARVPEALARDLERIDGLRVRLHRFSHEGRILFNVEAELPGGSPELVLVTAHLDSTAAFTEGYDARTDPAPGADD
ncbi:MAG TPA: HAD family hydrolase, partial [Longimicrobium sp.]|nr:HAD family hydrolase [Longimicrobium sp.]